MGTERQGQVQVYTGDGKGKTTAALGLALRAVGHGLKVIIIQFLKARQEAGETEAIKGMSNITLERFGSCHFVCNKPTAEDIELARRAFRRAEEAVLSGKYDLVILDEINVVVKYKMVDVEEILRLIKKRPRGVELVLTGRNAHPKVIEAADLVSEVTPVKHYYQKGIKARPGIEY